MAYQNQRTAMQTRGSAPAAEQKTSFAAYMTNTAVRDQIIKVVGSKQGDAFISSIVSAVQTNPLLSQCSNASIVSAALLGHSLNLLPSPQLGQFYMVPYKNKKTGKTEATFQIGYKGLLQLAMRSGQYKKINAMPIKAGELIYYDALNEEIEARVIEDPEEREKAETIGYYAMFEYVNGFQKKMYWTKEKMMAHADKYSMAFSARDYEALQAGKIPEKDMWKYSSFWYKDFDGMAVKTMIRQLISHWGIMDPTRPTDLQKAVEYDQSVIRNGRPDYVDNPQAAIDTAREEIVQNANAETIDIAPQEAATPATEAPTAPAQPTAAQHQEEPAAGQPAQATTPDW